jgi:7-carboxy-7-deazaguanine synthase
VRGSVVVNEIFTSIQGETTGAGRPCTFVRLTGCNLRCTWCDTAYAFHGGEQMSIDDVLEKVRAAGVRLVEVTGGEPLLQKEVHPLMERLLAEGYQVLLETSGERSIAEVPPAVVKIVDVKCPDSGEPDTFDLTNLAHLAPHDQVKFVIASRRDYEFARDFTRTHDLSRRVTAVIFSPVWGQVDLQAMADWILTDGLDVRFGYQLHKLIWGAEARGV